MQCRGEKQNKKNSIGGVERKVFARVVPCSIQPSTSGSRRQRAHKKTVAEEEVAKKSFIQRSLMKLPNPSQSAKSERPENGAAAEPPGVTSMEERELSHHIGWTLRRSLDRTSPGVVVQWWGGLINTPQSSAIRRDEPMDSSEFDNPHWWASDLSIERFGRDS